MAHKVIITCAVTGSIHTPSMSPHLPLTPRQIADEGIAAARAGAAVLHLHARDPQDGSPSFDPAVFRQFLPEIAQQTDAVINITTGGSHTMTLDQRLAAALDVSPEMASCNMGSMNFGYFQVLDKLKEFRFGWEREHLAGSRDRIFRNTFTDIEHIFDTLGRHGTRFEFECYDVGHLYTLKHFVDRGLMKGTLFLQFAMGILGGIGADPENLTHMKRIADKLFGDGYQFSVLAAGRQQMPMATQALLLGGHVRVGLEDSLGTDAIELMTRDGRSRTLHDRIDGAPLGKTNFVLTDSKGRVWFTVTTRTEPWTRSINEKMADGYVGLIDERGIRIVADGFVGTNEIRFDAKEEWLCAVESNGYRISRVRVAPDGRCSDREVFGPADLGAPPDGFAFDGFGNLWITLILAERLVALTPEGELLTLLDDGNAESLAAFNRHFAAGTVTPEVMAGCKGTLAPWMASVTFGGPDLRTVYLGSLMGTTIPYFRSPVPGLPLSHWSA